MREVIDSVPDVDGDEIEVSVLGDDGTIRLGMVTAPYSIRAVVDFDAHAADRFDRAWTTARQRAGQVRRACCDHCNNGEGDPAGHDYSADGPHDGPCGECAAEKARREHDAGTGD